MIAVPAAPGASAIGLLGELFVDGSLYVLDQADNLVPHGRMLKIDPHTHEVTTVASGLAFPNGMALDRRGNFYVADSLLGKIFKLAKDSSQFTVWVEDPALLSNNPNQNVGANDLAFDADQDFLYVTNAGNRQVLRVPVDKDGSPGRIELFADGAIIDKKTQSAAADGAQFCYRVAVRCEGEPLGYVESDQRDRNVLPRRTAHPSLPGIWQQRARLQRQLGLQGPAHVHHQHVGNGWWNQFEAVRLRRAVPWFVGQGLSRHIRRGRLSGRAVDPYAALPHDARPKWRERPEREGSARMAKEERQRQEKSNALAEPTLRWCVIPWGKYLKLGN